MLVTDISRHISQHAHHVERDSQKPTSIKPGPMPDRVKLT
jgi:hypothetical protein